MIFLITTMKVKVKNQTSQERRILMPIRMTKSSSVCKNVSSFTRRCMPKSRSLRSFTEKVLLVSLPTMESSVRFLVIRRDFLSLTTLTMRPLLKSFSKVSLYLLQKESIMPKRRKRLSSPRTESFSKTSVETN